MKALAVDLRLRQARSAFDWRLRSIAPDDWRRPTPCTEWDVRQLVNHVVGQELRMAALFRGGSAEQYIATRDDDYLGKDPVLSWVRIQAELDEVIAEPDAMERVLDYRTGPTPGAALLHARVLELVVHTWDLAIAIEIDASLEDGLVSSVLEALDGPLEFFRELFGMAGLFSASSEPSSDEPSLDRLLRLVGRAP